MVSWAEDPMARFDASHSIFKKWKSTGWYAVKTKGMNHHESPLVVTIR